VNVAFPLTPFVEAAILALMRDSPSALAILDLDRRALLLNPAVTKLVGRDVDELMGQDYLQVFAPEEQLSVAQRLEIPSTEERLYPSQIQRPDGTRRSVDVRQFHFEIEGETHIALIIIDVTEERSLLRKLGSLSQFVSSLTYAGSVLATLNGLAERVVETTHAVACTIVLSEQRGGRSTLKVRGSHGLPPEMVCLLEQALDSPYSMPAKVAIERKEMVTWHRMDCILQEMTLAKDVPAMQEFARYGCEQRWNTLVSLPMVYDGKILGALNSYYLNGALVGLAETTFLKTLADMAAVAVENARLVSEAQAHAVMLERQRLARELHDSVAQAIYGITLGLKTAQATLETRPEKAAAAIEYALDLSEGATREMRTLVFSLRPETLEQEGMVKALERHVDAMRVRYHLDVQADFCDEPELDSPTRLALYRVASEALHNIVKHARAKIVHIGMERTEEFCRLTIDDDGLGFETGRDYPGHLGLQSMRERVEAVGGEFCVDSKPGQGARITATVPGFSPDL
jgi:PAS domain S-box-containing protein